MSDLFINKKLVPIVHDYYINLNIYYSFLILFSPLCRFPLHFKKNAASNNGDSIKYSFSFRVN